MAKQIITALVRNGRLEYQADSKDILNKRIARLEGKYVLVEVKSLSPKTRPQLGYYHAVVLPSMVDKMNDLGWQDKDELPFTLITGDKEIKKIYARITHQEYKDKRDMTDEECGAFLDTMIKWGTCKLGAYIPEPTTGLLNENNM
jgi:hypothetical protein